MEFTYEFYKKLINALKTMEYKITMYNNCEEYKRSVILRHDIDFDLDKAVNMAELEFKLGVSSTYFVLLSTEFYNIFSKSSYKKIKTIMSLNHKIGLHFDEQRYVINDEEDLKKFVYFEAKIISELLGESINVVSMHRPSQLVLASDVEFDGLINSYSSKFFKRMKYISDSRMYWRENVMNIIYNTQHDKIHILTHPFWYSETNELIQEKLVRFINSKNKKSYNDLSANFRNLEEFINEDMIL